MKATIRRKDDMLTRVIQHDINHPLTPAIPRATALFAEARTLKSELLEQASAQVLGEGGFRGGATEKEALTSEIRAVLMDMAATARGLEPEHPGISDQFRLGRAASSRTQLMATATAFVTAATPTAMKALFTARAFPADFDEQLTAKVAALETAMGRKATGLQTQRLGSTSLDAISRRITNLMRELRALMVKHLRDNDPSMLEVWKTAARSYAPPVLAEGTPDDGGGSGTGGSGSGGGQTVGS